MLFRLSLRAIKLCLERDTDPLDSTNMGDAILQLYIKSTKAHENDVQYRRFRETDRMLERVRFCWLGIDV